MHPVLIATLSFSFSQVLLSIILLLRHVRVWTIQAGLLGIVFTAVIAFLATPLSADHWLSIPVFFIQTMLPGAFWLFCSSVFDDEFEMQSWKLALVATTLLPPVCYLILRQNGYFLPRWLFISIPQMLEFVLLILALYSVVKFWRDDLVQARRDLRLWFCAIIGVFSFTMIFLREIAFPGALWLQIWQYLPVGVICLITNLLFLQYRPGLISFEPTTENSVETPSPVDMPAEILHNLDSLMEDENLYRQMGLTIGQLAERLETPEYRLRKIINSGLGYRNFSDFLNGYRIKEAGLRLSDNKYADQAILNIALDAGFRSLSSFNKAFREQFGQTPTQYRDQTKV